MSKRNSILSCLTVLVLCATLFVYGAVPSFAAEPVKDCCDGIVPGDANLDGKITMKDASAILKYCVSLETKIDLDNADVRNDGAVNSRDASLLLKFIADWDVRLGHDDATEITVEPTCTEDGKSTLTCKICESTTNFEIAASGHSFDRGECVKCGEQGADYGYYRVADWLIENDEYAELASIAEKYGDDMSDLGDLKEIEGIDFSILDFELDEALNSLDMSMAVLIEPEDESVLFPDAEDNILFSEDILTNGISFARIAISETEMIFELFIIVPELIKDDPSLCEYYYLGNLMNENMSLSAYAVFDGGMNIIEHEGSKMTGTDFVEEPLTEEDIATVESMADTLTSRLFPILGECIGADFSPAWLGFAE